MVGCWAQVALFVPYLKLLEGRMWRWCGGTAPQEGAVPWPFRRGQPESARLFFTP